MNGKLAHRSPTDSKWGLSAFGFVGSFAPSIVKMFNQLPNIAFAFKWEWLVVILLYGLLGSLIALIYPYRGRPSAWRALLLGCSFPTLIGTAANVFGPKGIGGHLGGNAVESWSPWDFITLF